MKTKLRKDKTMNKCSICGTERDTQGNCPMFSTRLHADIRTREEWRALTKKPDAFERMYRVLQALNAWYRESNNGPWRGSLLFDDDTTLHDAIKEALDVAGGCEPWNR